MKFRRISEDTKVAYDTNGNIIEACQLHVWAYNQLEIAPELLKALKQSVNDVRMLCEQFNITDKECYLRTIDAHELITKVEESKP